MTARCCAPALARPGGRRAQRHGGPAGRARHATPTRRRARGPLRLLLRSPAGARGVGLGRRLVWLHTFGERLVPPGHKPGHVPTATARNTSPVGTGAADFPRSHSYDPEAHRLHVGAGVFEPVEPAVRSFSVSGLDVVGSWLDYRMRDGAGRRSSPLDEIRPQRWPAAFSEELLRVLWTIEHTVALQPELDSLLDAVTSGDVLHSDELPEPTEAERKAPD